MDFIRSKKTSLIDVLSTDASFILQHVQSKNLITRREYSYLQSMSQHGEKTAVELLDKLMNKNDQYCKDFISLLRENEILNTFPELRGLLPLHRDGPHQQAVQSSAPDNSSQEAILDKAYKMTSSPRGVCIIINNVNFKQSQTRQGSNEDAEALKKVFTWLDFTVECHEDLTKDEMKTIVQECSQRAGGDCFVCCVLSHGEAKGVLGCDNEVLPIEDILTPLKGHNCQALAGKPKLFFIQACRGKRFQNEVKIHTDGSQEDNQGLDLDANPWEIISIPADADFLVSMSTVDEHYSIRHSTNGSWFIQSLCKRLEEGILRGDDILTVLTKVNDDVCQEEGFIRGKKAKQVPDQSFRLRKRLVFPAPKSSDL